MTDDLAIELCFMKKQNHREARSLGNGRDGMKDAVRVAGGIAFLSFQYL